MDDNQHLIRVALQGAHLILETAAADGLPPIRLAQADEFGRVKFQVATEAEVDAWASWRGFPVTRKPASGGTETLLQAAGEMYDLKLEVYTVVPVRCSCGHPAASHHEMVGCTSGSPKPCHCSASKDAVLEAAAVARSRASHAEAVSR